MQGGGRKVYGQSRRDKRQESEENEESGKRRIMLRGGKGVSKHNGTYRHDRQ
jgi:hypothetical protein